MDYIDIQFTNSLPWLFTSRIYSPPQIPASTFSNPQHLLWPSFCLYVVIFYSPFSPGLSNASLWVLLSELFYNDIYFFLSMTQPAYSVHSLRVLYLVLLIDLLSLCCVWYSVCPFILSVQVSFSGSYLERSLAFSLNFVNIRVILTYNIICNYGDMYFTAFLQYMNSPRIAVSNF